MVKSSVWVCHSATKTTPELSLRLWRRASYVPADSRGQVRSARLKAFIHSVSLSHIMESSLKLARRAPVSAFCLRWRHLRCPWQLRLLSRGVRDANRSAGGLWSTSISTSWRVLAPTTKLRDSFYLHATFRPRRQIISLIFYRARMTTQFIYLFILLIFLNQTTKIDIERTSMEHWRASSRKTRNRNCSRSPAEWQRNTRSDKMKKTTLEKPRWWPIRCLRNSGLLADRNVAEIHTPQFLSCRLVIHQIWCLPADCAAW